MSKILGINMNWNKAMSVIVLENNNIIHASSCGRDYDINEVLVTIADEFDFFRG